MVLFSLFSTISQLKWSGRSPRFNLQAAADHLRPPHAEAVARRHFVHRAHTADLDADAAVFQDEEGADLFGQG